MSYYLFMKFLISFLLCSFACVYAGYADNDSLLVHLTNTIQEVPRYDQQKTDKIKGLTASLQNIHSDGLRGLFAVNEKIYEE